MKKRNSRFKAEWSGTREEHFRKYCEDILFRTGKEILVVENEVYLISGEEKSLLVQIDKPKKFWFEIWLKMKGL